VDEFLSEDDFRLFQANLLPIVQDPLTVAAVSALLQLRDELTWGLIPETCWPEVAFGYGAQLCAAVSGKFDRIPFYRKELACLPANSERQVFLAFICRALALGFLDKW
jgi:hypothetical protein